MSARAFSAAAFSAAAFSAASFAARSASRGSLRGGELGEVLGARTGGLAEVDLQAGEGVELEVGMADLLGVELVGEDVVVHLEGEGDGVAQAEVGADTDAGDRGDQVLLPQEGEVFLRIGLGDVVRAVLEAVGGAAADEHERIEHAVMLVAKQLRQVDGEVERALEVVELVHLERGDDSALALIAGEVEAQAEDGIELIPEGEGSGRGDQVLESGFADGVTGAALDLAEPVRIELQAGVGLALLRERHLGAQRKCENQC